MADEEKKNHEELIDRLKKEGQLTRNSGTNSLKTIKLELGKFDDAIFAMREKLETQTMPLTELVNIQKESLSIIEETQNKSESENEVIKEALYGIRESIKNQEPLVENIIEVPDQTIASENITVIREKLKYQTDNIKELISIQKKSLYLSENEIERQKQKDQLESVEKSVIGETGKKDGSKPDATKAEPGMLSGFFRRIGPGLGAFLGAAFGGLTVAGIASRLGGLLLRAIPLVALAPMIGDFIGDFVAAGLDDIGTSPETTEQMRETFNKAGRWGAYGAIFGPRGAAIGFFAGALSSFGESLLERFGIGEDDDLSILGIDVNALAGSETMLAAIGGTLALLAPSLLKLTGKLLLGALTGPVGLAALTGAALAGSVMLVEQWMQRRRDKFIKELEEKTKDGFAAVDEVAEEEDTSWWRRFRLSMGAAPETVTEELDVLRRSIDAASEPTGMGDFGSPESMAVLDPERLESLRKSMENILQNVDSLDGLSQRNLLDLKDMADRLQMRELSDSIRYSIEENKIRSDIRQLNEMRSNLTQAMGVSETDPRIAEIDTQIEEKVVRVLREQHTDISRRLTIMEDQNVPSDNIEYQNLLQDFKDIGAKLTAIGEQGTMEIEFLKDRSYRYGTKGFEDFGSGSLAMLHGIEAVVPRQTPAGEMLATAFDENFEPRFEVNAERMAPVLEQISTAAHSVVNNIVFAPTNVAPVTSVHKGGARVSSILQTSMTSFGGNGSGSSGLGRFAN